MLLQCYDDSTASPPQGLRGGVDMHRVWQKRSQPQEVEFIQVITEQILIMIENNENNDNDGI